MSDEVDNPVAERTAPSIVGPVALALLIAVGLAAAIAVGGSYVVYLGMRTATTEDAATIRRLTDEIVTIAIPESLAPLRATSARWGTSATQVRYFAKSAGSLALTHFHPAKVPVIRTQPPDMDALVSRLTPKPGQFALEKTETIERTINGQTARFTVCTLPGKNGWIVVGRFQGRDGPALFEMNVNAPTFSEEKILELINSMR